MVLDSEELSRAFMSRTQPDIFIYDAKTDLGLGKLIKTKNGILVRAFHNTSITEHCKNWTDAIIVDQIDALTNPVQVYANQGNLPHFVANLLGRVPGVPDRINLDPTDTAYARNDGIAQRDPSHLVVGPNISQCLDVCLFHGFNNITVPHDFRYTDLHEHQKKLFRKIFIRII